MASTEFRTKDELTRAQWAARFMSVTEGKQYTSEDDDLSPFPIHRYFQNKLLGKSVKMLTMNAGQALVEHFVADTLTDMRITVDGKETSTIEDEILAWFDEIDYASMLEESCRDYYGVGYGVQQVIRTLENNENGYTAVTLDPSTWYPDIPALIWQPVTSGRIISVFSEEEKGAPVWYAFVERHVVGNVQYELYRLESQFSLSGKQVPLSTIERFSGLDDSVDTELNVIPIYQANRQKSSRFVCGTSLLTSIWDILQEVSETQTQIRHERIKHLKAKFAAPRETLARVERDRGDQPMHSKQIQAALQSNAALYDINQEIFPVPAGAQMPAYIQRDLESITKGLELIDNLLSKASAIVGVPKSIFNIDDAAGNLKVETEKRKDRRYVRKVLQGQRRMANLVRDVAEIWWIWNKGGEVPQIAVEFESPFNLTKEETVSLMKQMNPMATLISEEDAVQEVHKDVDPKQRMDMLARIKGEKEQSELSRPAEIAL